jgi:uncharacterized membrane protein
VRRALIIFLAGLLVSVLAAVTMIGFAAFTKLLTRSVVGAVLIESWRSDPGCWPCRSSSSQRRTAISGTHS